MVFPKIHFGTYKIPASEATAAVEQALESGYRGIDTARAYGNEREVTQGILNFSKSHPDVKRSDIFYTTKVAQADFGFEKAKRAIDESLEKANGLGYIDLYSIHSSHGGPEVRSDTWRALEEVKKTGAVKHIGVSNWGVKHLEQLAQKQQETPFDNQIEINPWSQHRDIVDYCHKHNIIVTAYSPSTRGLRSKDPASLKLSEKYNKTPAQILVRWAIQYGTVPIPKSVTPSRMKENLDVFDWELAPEDFESLGDPNEYYVSAPAWDPTKLD